MREKNSKCITGYKAIVAETVPSRTKIIGMRMMNSKKELISPDNAVLSTNIFLGIKTLVTKADLLTMEAKHALVVVEKKRHAIMPTSNLMAKNSS